VEKVAQPGFEPGTKRVMSPFPLLNSPYARGAVFRLSQSPGVKGLQEGPYHTRYCPSCKLLTAGAFASAQIPLPVRKVS
jgi:hypothetical protein